jgi:hypothetical protein
MADARRPWTRADIPEWFRETYNPVLPKDNLSVEQRGPVLYTADEKPIYRAIGFVSVTRRSD